MEFKTDRLFISPFMSTDLQDVFDIYKDDDSCRYLLHDWWTSEDRQKKFNKKVKNSSLSKEAMLSLAVVHETKVSLMPETHPPKSCANVLG